MESMDKVSCSLWKTCWMHNKGLRFSEDFMDGAVVDEAYGSRPAKVPLFVDLWQQVIQRIRGEEKELQVSEIN